MKDAARKSYEAAKAKDPDKLLDAAEAITTACPNCHDKYREKATLANRCKRAPACRVETQLDALDHR